MCIWNLAEFKSKLFHSYHNTHRNLGTHQKRLDSERSQRNQTYSIDCSTFITTVFGYKHNENYWICLKYCKSKLKIFLHLTTTADQCRKHSLNVPTARWWWTSEFHLLTERALIKKHLNVKNMKPRREASWRLQSLCFVFYRQWPRPAAPRRMSDVSSSCWGPLWLSRSALDQ